MAWQCIECHKLPTLRRLPKQLKLRRLPKAEPNASIQTTSVASAADKQCTCALGLMLGSVSCQKDPDALLTGNMISMISLTSLHFAIVSSVTD